VAKAKRKVSRYDDIDEADRALSGKPSNSGIERGVQRFRAKRPVGSLKRGIEKFQSGKKEAKLKRKVGVKGVGPKEDTKLSRDPAQVSDFDLNDADRSAMDESYMEKPLPEEQPVSANAMEDAETNASVSKATEGAPEAVKQLLRRRVITEEDYHIPGEIQQPRDVPPAKAQGPNKSDQTVEPKSSLKEGSGKAKMDNPSESAMSSVLPKKKKRKVNSSVRGGY